MPILILPFNRHLKLFNQLEHCQISFWRCFMSKFTQRNNYYFLEEDFQLWQGPLWKNFSRFHMDEIEQALFLNESLTSHPTASLFLLKHKTSFSKINENFVLNEYLSLDSYYFSQHFGAFSHFSYLRHSFFITFFLQNSLDVPVCFTKSKSLKRYNNQLPLLKFGNFLMRQGKRSKSLKCAITAFHNVFLQLKTENFFKAETNWPWFEVLFFMTNVVFNKQCAATYNFSFSESLKYKNFLGPSVKLYSEEFFFKNNFTYMFTQVSPVFNFYIYNVDKNVRKFSRGKSGKYVFVWKYVAPYKRLLALMRWVLKEIKFNPKTQFLGRVEDVFMKLLSNPTITILWKSHAFAHSYVFKNYKKTLMTNLKTLT